MQVVIKKGSTFRPETSEDGFYLKLINDTTVNIPNSSLININGNMFVFSDFNNQQNNGAAAVAPGNNNLTIELPLQTVYCITDTTKDPIGIAKKIEIVQKFTFNQGTNIILPVNTHLKSSTDHDFEFTLRKLKEASI